MIPFYLCMYVCVCVHKLLYVSLEICLLSMSHIIFAAAASSSLFYKFCGIF